MNSKTTVRLAIIGVVLLVVGVYLSGCQALYDWRCYPELPFRGARVFESRQFPLSLRRYSAAGECDPEAGVQSFSKATDQLIQHFDAALVQFEADVRSGKANVRVASSGGGSGGGGSLDAIWLALLAVALALRLVYIRRAAAARIGTLGVFARLRGRQQRRALRSLVLTVRARSGEEETCEVEEDRCREAH